MSNGRNSPCPCGSGLKYKKCCLGKPIKPRTTSVTVDMGESVEIKAFGYSSTGNIVIIGKDGNPLQHASGRVERSYPREKGPKILSRVNLTKESQLLADMDRALLQFDTIFAIDSNTREIRGHRVSIAAIVLCKWLRKGEIPLIGFSPTQAIEFRDIDCHPDLLAWKHFLIRLKEHPDFSRIGKVALVADSHLGDLARIESHDQPIIDEFFLPSWASIVYATDSAKDRVANILLREADSNATNLLRQIENGDWREESQEPFFDHGCYFRVWEF